ncbi:MAG TPA: SMI1/KNR4 family protein [Gemmatimonadaceae bacterium]|jgi:hypothetical protein
MNRIRETEEELGVTFPAVFKIRMSARNGGAVHIDDEYWELYPFLDRTDRRTISRSSQDIRYHTREAMTRIGFPPDGIAIAHDSASDLLFLRRKGADLGQEVWRFDGYSGEVFQVLDDVGELWEPRHSP